jgi:hypothetical protein
LRSIEVELLGVAVIVNPSTVATADALAAPEALACDAADGGVDDWANAAPGATMSRKPTPSRPVFDWTPIAGKGQKHAQSGHGDGSDHVARQADGSGRELTDAQLQRMRAPQAGEDRGGRCELGLEQGLGVGAALGGAARDHRRVARQFLIEPGEGRRQMSQGIEPADRHEGGDPQVGRGVLARHVRSLVRANEGAFHKGEARRVVGGDDHARPGDADHRGTRPPLPSEAPEAPFAERHGQRREPRPARPKARDRFGEPHDRGPVDHRLDARRQALALHELTQSGKDAGDHAHDGQQPQAIAQFSAEQAPHGNAQRRHDQDAATGRQFGAQERGDEQLSQRHRRAPRASA